MKILNCVLFLTFMEFLYIKRAAGMMIGQSSGNPHPETHLVVVHTVRDCKYYDSTLQLVKENQPVDNPHSLRPLWMTNEVTSFPTYYIYIEMSGGRRYFGENLRALEHDKKECNYPDRTHLPFAAEVYIGNVRYKTTCFEPYRYHELHPEIEENNPGGRMYFAIKDTPHIRYADLYPDNGAAGMLMGQSSGDPNTKAHLVVVDTTPYCQFVDTRILLVPENQPLDNPPSLRPKWMTIPVTSFPTFYIYIEMPGGRRYFAENLIASRHASHHCLYDRKSHFPWAAEVYIGNIKYTSLFFDEYNYHALHPEISENHRGGRMYFAVKGTPYVRYSDIIIPSGLKSQLYY